MTIELDHTIVPARDKEAAARFFAGIMGLAYAGPEGPFAPVRVNETLTLDFADYESFESHHYAFRVCEARFDEILGRIRAAGLAYGSHPWALENGRLARRAGGRAVYFRDPDGHVLELLTRA